MMPERCQRRRFRENIMGVDFKKIGGTEKIIILLSLTVCIVVVSTFGLIRRHKIPEKPLPEKNQYTEIEDPVLILEPFIVPFDSNDDYTYITMDISFKFKEKELQKELMLKLNNVREIIYDVLLIEVERQEVARSMERTKEIIRNEINSILEKGQIHDVFVNRYNIL
jgi:flagellar basal body-associated protein FliL